ncbi:DUF6283 family protein [Curtobacterium sp. MCBD17_040]|uniref:DUF6283 family protein n=1 Tax=Curtobacterium sp. MCBD17_040 TaxID=2175674 RepID=UPI000DA8E047|nr:DUF6283 family protein [Curtobacterium sp. MCBD17_040]WIB65271.1 DUF6283 family protein [Curtobacterium sp. MCBD17_040]
MTDEPAKPRPRPCASCPFRRDVPSGVWAADEYDKLTRYDGPTYEQSPRVFMCHQGRRNEVCSGWLGHTDEPWEMLAVRIGVLDGSLDPSCAEYTTTVPLFPSGTAAAEHGKREMLSPGADAARTIDKVTKIRALRGDPVTKVDPFTGEPEA